jgi:V8-like Glu-specific endopeptidase
MSSESLKTFVDVVRAYVVAGQLPTALHELQNYLSGAAPDLNREVSIYTARYNRLRRDDRMGLLTHSDAQAQENKLVHDILRLLEEVPNQVAPSMSPVGPAKPGIEEQSAEVADVEPETILHLNVLKQVHWIARAVEVSNSVCRLLTPKGLATGFLVAPGILMTNNHVIPDQNVARQSQAEFNYEQDVSGKYLTTYRYRLNPDVFHTSPADKLDYTLVGVAAAAELPPLEKWRHVELNPFADPFPSEHVVIIQHPNGGLKQIALTANVVVQVKTPYLRYTTDTMPGSSGSPVFNDSWQVIAIHHAGVNRKTNQTKSFTNEGILMSAIKADVGEHWPA